MTPWPFEDPPNCVSISLRDIMERRRPILRVGRDDDDSEVEWQFTDGRDAPRVEDAVILCLESVLRIDPSIAEVADLPVGWRAVRDAVGSPWVRFHPDDPDPKTE
jgi:hypothetical protein